MTRSPKSNDQTAVSPNQAILLLSGTIADTTWRMFLPTIGGTVIGIVLDRNFNVKPIMTIIFVGIGFAISMALIYKQINGAKR